MRERPRLSSFFAVCTSRPEGRSFNGINIAHIPPRNISSLSRCGIPRLFSCLHFHEGKTLTPAGSENGNTVEACVEKSGLTEKLASLPQGLRESTYPKNSDEKTASSFPEERRKAALARPCIKTHRSWCWILSHSALEPWRNMRFITDSTNSSGENVRFIFHRLSSTRFTDKIAVFSEGRLAEYGNHEELMKIDQGIYAALFRMQAQYYV